MSLKPRVTFKEVAGYTDYPGGAITAALSGVKGHPRLGDERIVHTSAIVGIGYDEDFNPCSIETLNTVYVKEE